ncbi:MAG: SH3 domain-containing protein [Pyrinomonadaceae bacterium]
MDGVSISRRKFLVLVSGGITLSTISLSGCQIAPVIIRVAPILARVFWGAIQLGEAALTIKALVEATEQYLTPSISTSDITNLQMTAPLIIIDGRGTRFNIPYVVCEYAGFVQSCYRGESRTLHNNPGESAKIIRNLQIGETLGVIDLKHVEGWYHVQTVSGEKGWVHGNCLERLPKKY